MMVLQKTVDCSVKNCLVFFFRESVYSGISETLSDIRFEQASILYNIGALHSILGALDNRSNAEVTTNQ